MDVEKKIKSIVRSFRSGKCWKCSYNPEKREETFLKKGNSLDLKYPDVAKYLNKTKIKKNLIKYFLNQQKNFGGIANFVANLLKEKYF